MEIKFKMDYGSILTQLFSINARIEALADQFVKTDEQKESFKESFVKHFKRIVNEFDDQFPGVIDKNPFRT